MSEERFSVTSLISRSKSACAIKATTAQALTLVFLFFNLALILLSVQVIDAIKLTFAIILQLIPGLYLWAKINMGKKLFLSELLGMGLAIGTLLSIVSGSLFRTLPLSGFGWTAPFFLSILFIVRSRFFKNDLRISIKINTISIGNQAGYASNPAVNGSSISIGTRAGQTQQNNTTFREVHQPLEL